MEPSKNQTHFGLQPHSFYPLPSTPAQNSSSVEFFSTQAAQFSKLLTEGTSSTSNIVANVKPIKTSDDGTDQTISQIIDNIAGLMRLYEECQATFKVPLEVLASLKENLHTYEDTINRLPWTLDGCVRKINHVLACIFNLPNAYSLGLACYDREKAKLIDDTEKAKLELLENPSLTPGEISKKYPKLVFMVTNAIYLIDKKRYRYTGPIKNGVPEGKGVLKYPNGSIYNGTFKKGKPEGKGVILYNSGPFFDPSKNTINPTGKFIGKYEGEFRSGKPDGKGVFQNKLKNSQNWNNQVEEYAGDFINGKFDGVGEAKMSDGSILKGNFKDGKPLGPITRIKDMRAEIVDFKNDKIITRTTGEILLNLKLSEPLYGSLRPKEVENSVNPTLFIPGRGYYKGPYMQFFVDQKTRFKPDNDLGTMFYEDGSRYTGPFLDGVPSGKNGMLILSNGDVYAGEFLNGSIPTSTLMMKLLPDETIIGEDGKEKRVSCFFLINHPLYPNSIFRGDIFNGQLSGFGEIEYEGKKYRGNFVEGKLEDESNEYIFSPSGAVLHEMPPDQLLSDGVPKYPEVSVLSTDPNIDKIDIGNGVTYKGEMKTIQVLGHSSISYRHKAHGEGILTINKIVYNVVYRDGVFVKEIKNQS